MVTFSSFICLLESRILYTNSIPFIHYTLATFSFQLSLPEVPTANFFLFFFKKVLFFLNDYLFIYYHAASSLLCVGFLYLRHAEVTLCCGA